MNRVLTSFLFVLICQQCFGESISYEIYAHGESADEAVLVGAGTRVYSGNDLEINPYERDGKHIREVLVELEQGFRIGARIFSERRLTGFGLLAKKTDRDFSWEWYDKVSNGSYVKRQGGTYVAVKTYGLPMIEEPSEIEFREDTKLSFILGGPGEEITHFIIVKKGSVLRLRVAP